MTKSNEPKVLKDIHDIRLKIYEETRNLSPGERAAQTNKMGREIIAKYCIPPRPRSAEIP